MFLPSIRSFAGLLLNLLLSCYPPWKQGWWRTHGVSSCLYDMPVALWAACNSAGRLVRMSKLLSPLTALLWGHSSLSLTISKDQALGQNLLWLQRRGLLVDSIYVRDGLSPILLKNTTNVSGRQVHTRTRRDQRRYCQHVWVSWENRIKSRVSDNLVKLPILQREKN